MKDRINTINYCTHSNLNDLSYGDSNNDNKFIISIPSKFNLLKVFPKRNKANSISIPNFFKIILKLISLSLRSNQIFVIRGTRPGFIPIFFKKQRQHKIILNMGCTPLSTIERTAFFRNPAFRSKYNLLSKILLKLEFQFEKFLIRNADFIFVENETAKKIVAKYCDDSSKIKIAPYYVQNYFLTTEELKYNYNDRKPLIIGYTGRFHKYDKLDPLVDAIHILKNNEFPIVFKLVGNGPTKLEIQRKVNNLNLNNEIIFLGSQPHQIVSKIIDTEHILVLPMVNNICPSTVPIKILEGIIKGKIILTNNSGNIKSLFHPYTDLVLEDFSDPHLIAEKIIHVAQNYEKYYKIAQILRKKHLETCNSEYFRNQIVKTLDLIKL